MSAVHDFQKKISNFVTIHPKTPLSMIFYVWASKLLKKIVAYNFPKNIPQTWYNPLVGPKLFFKKKALTSHKLTKHSNIIKQPQTLQQPLHIYSTRQKEDVVESMKDTGLARQGPIPFSSLLRRDEKNLLLIHI
jgi:hypothetical protein